MSPSRTTRRREILDTIKNSGDFGAIGFDEVGHDRVVGVVGRGSRLPAETVSTRSSRWALSGTGDAHAIPEPSTWAMMLLGFAGLGYAAWRGGRKGSVSIIEA